MNSYDAIAEIYDEDMGANNDGDDIGFFLDYARKSQGKVLELGCGTGRITLPLIKEGLEVVAIDISRRMLDVLERKMRNDLSPSEMKRLSLMQRNMIDFVSEERFSMILCPFCAFTYLVDPVDQLIFLNNMRGSLRDDGVFILDSFVPKYDILSQHSPIESFDYERALRDGTILRRRKIINQNLTDQINEVTRIYEIYDASRNLLKTISMNDRIRYMFKNELELFLVNNGFEIINIFGDYRYAAYSYQAHKMVFVLRKATR
jgi:SAM-dependent methyltransferase